MCTVNKKIFNKRKKNFLPKNIKIFIYFIVISIFCIFSYLNNQKIFNFTHDYVNKYSEKYDYNLSKIEISNLKYFSKDEISIYFEDYYDKSIFLIPINKLANDIRRIKWVKKINIKHNYKNTLSIEIDEEIPLGIYVQNDNQILFSENLIILKNLKKNHNFSNLILFFGENSIINSKILIENLAENLINNIITAIYVSNRRWDLVLENKIILRLPEENIKDAIKNYEHIYLNLSTKELKEIESIDLRIKKQAIIKYKN